MASIPWIRHEVLVEEWPVAVVTLLALAILFQLFSISLWRNLKPNILIVNGRKAFELSDSGVKARYRANAKELLLQGLAKSNAFYLNTDNRRLLVLANEYVADIGKNPYMDLSKAVEAELPCHVPGYEGYRASYFPDHFGVGIIRHRFGKAFEPYLTPMSLEIADCLQSDWPRKSEWLELSLRSTCMRLLTQLTSSVRSGELSKHAEWVRISTDFQTQIYIAAADLARWPKFLHRFLYPFLPSVQKLRADIRQARVIFEPFLEERRAGRRQAMDRGEDAPKHDDLVDWLDEGSRGRRYDATMAQLVNAQALASPAADLLVSILVNIAERPKLAQEMRDEIHAVVRNGPADHDALSRLHLMDSVAKESSRYKAIHTAHVAILLMLYNQVGLKRWAEKSITLSDGFVVPKGSLIAIAMQQMWDESIYPSALEFQGDRFLKRRQQSGEHDRDAKWTTPSEDHLGFGFGRHACPGRWYASHLVKLILCHILLKYDMRLLSGAQYQEVIEIKRRENSVTL